MINTEREEMIMGYIEVGATFKADMVMETVRTSMAGTLDLIYGS